MRKPAIVPTNTTGPTGPSAAVAAVLEGHGVLMGTSVDEQHLIHKPPTVGLAAGDLTGAMHVTDAINFGGFHGHQHGHHSPMVRLDGWVATALVAAAAHVEGCLEVGTCLF